MEANVDPDEISLLDLLVTAAESWKLLIFGPIASAPICCAGHNRWTFMAVGIEEFGT